MERLITPENINRVGQADKELNAFINMLKDDSTTFGHIDKGYFIYITPLLQKYYPEVVKSIIDIRHINDIMTDVELNSGIITFTKHDEQESIGTSCYRIVNDICLSTSAEIETESGYMEYMTVEPLLHGGYHLIFRI